MTGRVRHHPIIAFVVTLAVLFVVADRATWWLAERGIASALQHTRHLAEKPSVDIQGFPLLTQVAAQRYDEIDVTAHGITQSQVRVSRLDVHLRGVHASTTAVLAGNLHHITADTAEATALISYDDLDAMLRGQGVTVSYAGGGRLHVAATVSAGGGTYRASGDATLRLDGDSLAVTAQTVDMQGAGGLVGGLLSRLAKDRLSFHLLLSGLPFGLRVQRVQAHPDGVLAYASARDVSVNG